MTHDTARKIAWLREEWEACERGTEGCCIDHGAEADGDGSCQTW